MLSVADIPMAGIRFTGIIGIILWHGKEYKIATYLEARLFKMQNETVWMIQRRLKLDVRLLEASGRPTKALAKGNGIIPFRMVCCIRKRPRQL